MLFAFSYSVFIIKRVARGMRHQSIMPLLGDDHGNFCETISKEDFIVIILFLHNKGLLMAGNAHAFSLVSLQLEIPRVLLRIVIRRQFWWIRVTMGGIQSRRLARCLSIAWRKKMNKSWFIYVCNLINLFSYFTSIKKCKHHA